MMISRCLVPSSRPLSLYLHIYLPLVWRYLYIICQVFINIMLFTLIRPSSCIIFRTFINIAFSGRARQSHFTTCAAYRRVFMSSRCLRRCFHLDRSLLAAPVFFKDSIFRGPAFTRHLTGGMCSVDGSCDLSRVSE